ncbi:MAG TPA: response regulator [Flavisolibacter sp.]
MRSGKNYTILYIDDDADDVQMLQEAIHTIDPAIELRKANDGEEGLSTLSDMEHGGQPPCLIVLDINMPRLDGRQTFKRIKADPRWMTIPIVIFSTSNNPMDKMFFGGKNVEYITKPISFSHLLQVAQRLLSFCAT